jgi:integrase
LEGLTIDTHGAMPEQSLRKLDFKNGVLYLDDEQKVEPVVAPIYGDMKKSLLQQKKFRDENFPHTDHVFFWYPLDCEIDRGLRTGHGGRRNEPGSPIQAFSKSWTQAVAQAGHPGLLFHDLRRSAVRNLIRLAGLSEKEAMEISGHKTDAMIGRYNIKGNQDVQRLGQRLDEFWKQQTDSEGKLLSSRRLRLKPRLPKTSV